MDQSNIQTPTPSSTITADSSLSSQPLSPHPLSASPNSNHILEITLISAQDLFPVCKSLRTYALTWVNPNRKRTTRVDNQGHNNPYWNDKFSFRVDDEFLNSESSAVHVEVYTVSWFRDILVGTVKVVLNNLINPFDRSSNQSKKFVALQIRRPSGNPQGILNMGVALIDKSKRSLPLFNEITPLSLDHRDILDRKINDINAQDQMINDNNQDDEKLQISNKIQMWQSQSLGYSEVNNGEFPGQAGSICNANGSIINGSELCSDIGPSASIVAAEIAKKLHPMPQQWVPSKALNKESGEGDDGESSIVEELMAEEAYAKGLEERKKEAAAPERGSGGHTRRNIDGGLYSCFGNAYCFEFTIMCGASNNDQGNRRVNNSNRTGKSRKKTNSA